MYKATLKPILGHRVPPTDFLDAVVDYCITAPDSIFEPNLATQDLFTLLRPRLAPDGWLGMLNRRAAMAEGMRVHAAFESDYNWNEGVDTTNAYSQVHIVGEETGIFQVSFDSEWLDPSLRTFTAANGIDTPEAFIQQMKANHNLAIDYYARLIHVTTRWAGPWNTGRVAQSVSIAAYTEFLEIITGRYSST